MIYDVIIIGGGPAGATLGYELAKKGFSVLIIEKTRFPRYKVCAGGVPLILRDLIGDFPYERRFDSVLLMKEKKVWRFRLSASIVTVRRDNFDEHLLNKAGKAGARIKFEIARGIESNNKVTTAKGSYQARVVVGADGAFSLVRRAMGIGFKRWVNTVEWEIPGRAEDFVVSVGPGPGYAWSWPKRYTIAFGGGGFGRPERWALRLAEKLGLNVEDNGYHYRYPIWEMGPRIRDNMVVIGDAGAFASPLTGAGIYTGTLSALAAGQMIENHLKFNKPFADPCFRSLYKELVPASRLTPILFSFPGSFMPFAKGVIGRTFGLSCGYLRIIRSLWRGT